MTHEQVLRTGVLFKKGSGIGPFGRKNWKPRYFVLTPTKLTYYTYEDGELKGEVDLTGCNEQSIEVMPADSMKTGSSASTIWRIAINSSDRRLLVAAGTEMEMNDWVEQLFAAFRINSGQPALPQRHSLTQPVLGAVVTTGGTENNLHQMTDFQNFAAARRSVGGAMRASTGVYPGHEFRLSDEQLRRQQRENERRHSAMEAERLRDEELLHTHMRSQEEEQRAHQQQRHSAHSQRSDGEDHQRQEDILEKQRRLKREQHERERIEAERHMRQQDMLELERRHEQELREQFEADERMSQGSSTSRLSGSSSQYSGSASPPRQHPRSAVIGDAKKEALQRQQLEHNRRREAAIKEQQEQMRRDFLSQKKQQDDAVRASHVKAKPTASRQAASPPAAPTSPLKPATVQQQQSTEFRSMVSYEF